MTNSPSRLPASCVFTGLVRLRSLHSPLINDLQGGDHQLQCQHTLLVKGDRGPCWTRPRLFSLGGGRVSRPGRVRGGQEGCMWAVNRPERRTSSGRKSLMPDPRGEPWVSSRKLSQKGLRVGGSPEKFRGAHALMMSPK